MLLSARRSGVRVALVLGLLALVMVVSSAQFTVVPTSDAPIGGGFGAGYPRYTGPVETERRGGGAGGWNLAPALGVVLAVGLLAVAVRALQIHRRARTASADEPPDGPTLPAATTMRGEVAADSDACDEAAPSGSHGDGVDVAWRRVETFVADEGVGQPVSRTTAWTLREALRLGAPPAEARALARLHDAGRYSGRPVAAEVELEAARLADVVVGGAP